MTPSPVEGLPEGVAFVRIGTPGEDDYYMVNEPDGQGGHEMRIVQGQRAADFASPTPHLTLPPNAAVIVKAADGWKFRASIRSMSLWPVKVIKPPAEIVATAKFSVADEFDRDKVNKGLDNLKTLPGFVGIS